MEKRQREGTVEGSRSHQSTLTGTLALKNFTIPRKKRTSGEDLLERCSEESRDYNLIQTKLRDAMLDTREDRANAWVWKDVCLVHNEELLKKFLEKRAEMRAKGRHGREMEERFCFLASSDQMAAQIYRHGLQVGSTVQYALGKPSHGVYLFRHVDVALKSNTNVLSLTKVVIFKVLYGKVKKSAPSLDWNKTQDPTVSFDCHMCKDAVSYRDTLHQQVLGSSVFLFDFNEKQELTERPRQCLPYAVVSFVPSSSAILTVPTNLALSASALPVGQVHDRFKACHLPERKGSTATIKFNHFGMSGCCETPHYTPQKPEVEAPFQKSDIKNTQSFNPKQHWIAASEEAASSSSGPVMDNTAISQSLLGKKLFLSNHKKRIANNDNTWDIVPQSPLDKISSLVYSSRLVSDPRLSRKEGYKQTNHSEAKVAYAGSGCDNKECQPTGKNQEDNYGFAGNKCDSKEPTKKDTQTETSRIDQCSHTLTLPSMKLFKMKFQKYAAYFRMNEEERHLKIWSQENMSAEQKQELADRIHFYEGYYHKYKNGLIFQNVDETKKKSIVSQIEPKENHILQTKDDTYKHDQSYVCQTRSRNAASLSDNRGKCSTTPIHETSLVNHAESSAVMLPEKGQDQAPETSQDHPDRCLVHSPDKLSEQSLVLTSSNLNLTGEKTETQSVHLDLRHPSPLSCPSNEAKLNHRIERESELSRRAIEDQSTPGDNLVEKLSTGSSLMYANNVVDNNVMDNNVMDNTVMDNTVMDIASCVEVSSCGPSDNSDLNPPMTVKQKEDGKTGSDVQEMGTFRWIKCCEDSSPELDMETVKRDDNTHCELYKRIQLDRLLPSMFEKHVFSSSTDKDMSGPADNISKLKNESKDHSEAETNLNIKVTLKSSKTSEHTTGVLSLSERFSKIKGLQKKLIERNNKMIQSRSGGHKETATCNAELIQLLAQRYSKSKLYVKCNHLSRPGYKKSCLKKQHTFLSLRHSLKRSKYVKKTSFWKAKRNLSRATVSADETLNSKATPDSSNSQSEIVFTGHEDQDPDSNLRISHTSDDGKSLHVQASQEVTATLPETKLIEEPINPTEDLYKNDSVCTENATTHFTPYLIPVIVDKGEQVKPTENISNQSQMSLITCSSKKQGRKECEEEKMLPIVTSETGLNPLRKEQFTFKFTVDDKVDADCKVSETHSDVPASNTTHKTELRSNVTPEAKLMDAINATAETETIKCSEQNANMKNTPNVRCFEETELMSAYIPHMNQSCLKMFTNTSNVRSVWSTDSEAFGYTTLDSEQCRSEALNCTSNNIVDLTVDEPALSVQCEISSKRTKKNSNTSLLGSDKSQSTPTIRDDCNLSRPDQNKTDEVNSPETQLISKLRDYLTKFESTVKKQESVNEDLKERPVMWITLDSTAHKQQLYEKSQYCMVNVPCLMSHGGETVKKNNSSEYTEAPVQARKVLRREHARHGSDVCLLVPVEPKRGRRSSQTKRTSKQRSRRSSVPSVSPDSTSAIDTIKGNSPHPLPPVNDRSAVFPEISINNTFNAQLQMQRKHTTAQQNSSVNLNSVYERQSQENQSLNTVNIIDDGNVSSTFPDNKYSISDISNTLKKADQTVSLTELGSLQSKCKSMLQHFILSFEQDQQVSFNQSFVSRCLILEQYLDHPPAQVDLKYEAVNSYLELQMMMEAWQFVENKINFLSGKPTFRSLLWYDPSLYGELYKGEVGFQQQSSLFASFQKILAQEGYSKLQEYYSAVFSLHQQLNAAPDASYYMYLKSKREILEAEAALRNAHDIKSFFLSVPMSAMINLGDSLERLEKIHKVIMTFVETPSDQLPGTFDVGKAEHLSITCRYLQEKALFMKSCKDMISKVSWFGIEHLLYDASKVLVWQDMNHGAPNEVLKTYKNSNPQIIFGVTESGVTLVNKVEQPPPSINGSEISTKQKSDAARKRKSSQLWTSSQPSVAQSVKADKDVAYKMAKRRPSLSPLTQCNGVKSPFQSTSSSRVEIPTPYYALPHGVDPGHWGMVGSTAADWNASNFPPNLPPSPSTSHANSLHLSNRWATSSHSDDRRSLADIQRPQQPSVSAPQATLRGDSCVSRLAPHCPVLSQEQVNHFNLSLTQPYSLPNCPSDANLIPPPLSVQALTHVPMPSAITAIHYPYFLLNGQTYTTDSNAAIHPNTRYYPNTI